ncbi:molybdate ABC transporter, ATPase component [Lachnospiraceae bacterium TWA4]|nr:molybdate ABC transporter, ATPase component [Lachnospiraceae bacterium TWA4]
MALDVQIKKKLGNFHLDIKMENISGKLGILGASGCGKSMTLKCIAGIEKPDEGKILLNDRVLFDSKKRINLKPQVRNVGYLFQNYALFPNMTVSENIGIGIQEKNKEKRQEIIARQLKQFHLEGLGDRYPTQLSGGQQQRVALGRIMAYNPDVILLDEPFSALDSFLKEILQEQLIETLQDYHGDILMVTHSRDEVYQFCEKLMCIQNGKSISIGDTQKLFESPVQAEVAKLTGCKNLSKIRKIDEYTLEAIDWKFIFHSKVPISNQISHIGIRAHDLIPHWGEAGENCIPIQIKTTMEFPFEKHLFLETDGGSDIDHQLCWFVAREKWKKIMDKGNGRLPNYLYLPQEAVMLLED